MREELVPLTVQVNVTEAQRLDKEISKSINDMTDAINNIKDNCQQIREKEAYLQLGFNTYEEWLEHKCKEFQDKDLSRKQVQLLTIFLREETGFGKQRISKIIDIPRATAGVIIKRAEKPKEEAISSLPENLDFIPDLDPATQDKRQRAQVLKTFTEGFHAPFPTLQRLKVVAVSTVTNPDTKEKLAAEIDKAIVAGKKVEQILVEEGIDDPF